MFYMYDTYIIYLYKNKNVRICCFFVVSVVLFLKFYKCLEAAPAPSRTRSQTLTVVLPAAISTGKMMINYVPPRIRQSWQFPRPLNLVKLDHIIQPFFLLVTPWHPESSRHVLIISKLWWWLWRGPGATRSSGAARALSRALSRALPGTGTLGTRLSAGLGVVITWHERTRKDEKWPRSLRWVESATENCPNLLFDSSVSLH